MVNGIDLVSFVITFGGGFIIGCFFGIMLMSLMVASSNDSRWREEHEDSGEMEE